MQTTDPDLLFQTSLQISQGADRARKVEAAKNVGHAVNVGKVIELAVEGSEILVAESGWQARRVNIKTGKTLRTYRGHQGPVTAVALHKVRFPDGSPRHLLFTGSWDKTIKIWELESGVLLNTLVGHTDFVKSLTLLPRHLVSTSSDRTIRLWDLGTIAQLGINSVQTVQTIKLHTRPVDRSVSATRETGKSSECILWTADSMGVIHVWTLDPALGTLVHVETIKGHETSVTDLLPVEDGLWSVSMDKTAQYHPFGSTKRVSIPHDSSVHSVLLLPAQITTRSILLTGSDDEDIRVWESEDDWQTYTMISRVVGHCGPVTSIKCGVSNGEGVRVITGSLDGTLRSWTFSELLDPPELEYDPTKARNVLMTEEEERELAELMSDE